MTNEQSGHIPHYINEITQIHKQYCHLDRQTITQKEDYSIIRKQQVWLFMLAQNFTE